MTGPEVPTPPSRAPRVLVLDDNPLEVNVLQTALRESGCETTAILDGSRVLAIAGALKHREFDLVVVDWRIPGVSGDSIVGALLDVPAGQGTIVVVLSSAVPLEVKDRLEPRGVQFREKPMDLEGYEQLSRELRELAARTRS